VLEPLGYKKTDPEDSVTYTLGPNTIYIVKPYDGRAATAGNGSMHAFRVATQADVHKIH
jgi:hypothetical protein